MLPCPWSSFPGREKCNVETEARGHREEGELVQTCRAKMKQHTIRWVSQIPAVTEDGHGSGPGSDMQRQKQPLSEGLFAYCLQVWALHPLTGTMFSFQHPWIVYISCNGFTEGLTPHLACVTVKSVTAQCVMNTAWSGCFYLDFWDCFNGTVRSPHVQGSV